jgi:factor associated with neutral sphingomyelinase activation
MVFSLQRRVKFDLSWLEDLREVTKLELQANKISPLVVNPGRVLLTDQRLYFQPYNNVEPLPVLKIKLTDVSAVIKRRFLLQHIGLELIHGGSSLFLSFRKSKDRDSLYALLSVHAPSDDCLEKVTQSWRAGALSNYEYLSYLNKRADRSFNDLSQYPVFPWVLADYASSTLNLEDPGVYRDLSKPIGALNPKRLAALKSRMEDMAFEDGEKFLYGSHYSAPGFVLFYLARKMPEFMLCLNVSQRPSCLFNSI